MRWCGLAVGSLLNSTDAHSHNPPSEANRWKSAQKPATGVGDQWSWCTLQTPPTSVGHSRSYTKRDWMRWLGTPRAVPQCWTETSFRENQMCHTKWTKAHWTQWPGRWANTLDTLIDKSMAASKGYILAHKACHIHNQKCLTIVLQWQSQKLTSRTN